MTDTNDGPAVPINGPTRMDGECAIIDDTTVIQWSEWAGMWDTAYHAACPADARRYVREHEANEGSLYRVAGECRQEGAIGTFEPFFTTLEATSVEDARDRLTEGRSLGEAHVKVIARKVNASTRVDELASEYWRERQKPGGTIETPDGKVAHSDRCREIYEEMGRVQEAAAEENEATLRRAGVPARLAVTASTKDLDVWAVSLRWSGSFPDPYKMDQLVSPPLRVVEEWTDGARWVWTDDERLIVTYCEGDTTGEYYLTPAAFAEAWAKAAEFYKNH